jgi:hypothetical protein
VFAPDLNRHTVFLESSDVAEHPPHRQLTTILSKVSLSKRDRKKNFGQGIA